MRRRSLALLAGLLAMLVFSMPAGASVRWCHADPIVRVDGVELQFWVAVPEEYVPYVNGAIDIRIRVPKSVTDRQVLFIDKGFNGYGEKVTWGDLTTPVVNGQIPMEITVKVPFDRKKLDQALGTRGVLPPVQVEVIQDGVSSFYYGDSKQTRFLITLIVQDEVI
jgi:hypothetical protein